jgi:hypothetical protein
MGPTCDPDPGAGGAGAQLERPGCRNKRDWLANFQVQLFSEINIGQSGPGARLRRAESESQVKFRLRPRHWHTVPTTP